MGDTGRRGRHYSHLLVILLVIVGLSLVEGRHRHASSERKEEISKSKCNLPPKVNGLCQAYFPSWSYVKSSGKCEEFIYTGCVRGKANRFNSQSECEQTCLGSSSSSSSSTTTRKPDPVGPSDEERCDAPLYFEKGSAYMCKLPISLWSYDESTDECTGFPRCAQNASINDFPSKSECEKACLDGPPLSSTTTRKPNKMTDEEICNQPERKGYYPCNHSAWTFDKASGKCRKVPQCGYDTTKNSFDSQHDCARTCESHSSETISPHVPVPMDEDDDE